ncbi:Sec-independent protein translocase subunit TatA [Brevibacterium album]|uniref:Sec-independent protein translocase subunit TatA n=1 Tax=Brevibacterium album TaxID=417948 RepID=UPI00041C0D5A|nr:Sec-independent protein translocase subunit TatA [Brevibacterium album]
MRPQPVHFIILIVVVLLIFGAPKLPSIARSIGKSMKVFKSEVEDLRGDRKDEFDEDERPAKRIDRTSSAPTVDDVTGASERAAEPRTEDETRKDR